MRNTVLQYSFIIGLIFFLGIVLFFLRNNALSIKYALLWLFSIFIMLVICIFQNIPDSIAKLMGFELASNAVFSLLLGFVIIILLQLTSIVSRQTEKIKMLVQMNALLEKRVRELEVNYKNWVTY